MTYCRHGECRPGHCAANGCQPARHEHRGFVWEIGENGRGDLFLDVEAPADEDGVSHGISIPLREIARMRAAYSGAIDFEAEWHDLKNDLNTVVAQRDEARRELAEANERLATADVLDRIRAQHTGGSA